MGILATMLVVNEVSTDLYVGLIALSIIVLCAASWTVFLLLLWTERQAPDIQSLHDRVDDALTLALVSTVAAVIGFITLGRLFGLITVTVGTFITVGLGFIVVEVSIPAIGFLRTWRDVYLPMVRGKRDVREAQEATDAQSR